MRELWMRLRNYMERSLRRQLVFYLMLGVLLPLTLVTSLLFVKARQEMKNQAVGNIRQRSQTIASQVDELLYNIQGVSDKLAYDEEIEACIEKEYGDISMEKHSDVYALNAYFNKTDPMLKSQRISALLTKKQEVFNFQEPFLDGADIRRRLLELGAMDRSSLSMFRWYPLQKNFLRSSFQGDVRRDQAVMGVRRILHPFSGVWMYTQFFAIEEEKLYSLYRESVKELKGQVYIASLQGRLISSSDGTVLAQGQLPEGIMSLVHEVEAGKRQVSYEDESYIVDVRQMENADWMLVAMVPVREATATVDKLFKEIIAAMAVCIFACITIINWISRRFLQPVEVLDLSMKEVHDGNLEAYVKPDAYHGEIRSMMTYYNAMLVKINHYIREQVESEKKKKELELEVLMGQINPHFLYNTLENIVWKSNEVGRPDIGRMAASLGRLYRLSIGNGETIVPIRQEVEHVMAYVNIQKSRYKERMEFDLRVNYEEIWGFAMIKLTLQPVVENCFMYGMEGISHPLKIRLSVHVGQDTIRFVVADNGCGMTKHQLEEVRRQIGSGKPRTEGAERKRRKGTGIGLYSVKERISIYTGYTDGVRIAGKAGMGTMVSITIPKISVKDKKDKNQP